MVSDSESSFRASLQNDLESYVRIRLKKQVIAVVCFISKTEAWISIGASMIKVETCRVPNF
jgi:hypothetical protein